MFILHHHKSVQEAEFSAMDNKLIPTVLITFFLKMAKLYKNVKVSKCKTLNTSKT